MPKVVGNNRISALQRLSKPYSVNDPKHRLSIGSNNSSIKDARQILVNRNKTSFDARQLLTRPASTSLDLITTKNLIVRKNLPQSSEDMVVVTGIKDMKMKDGQLIRTTPTGHTQTDKKKNVFSVGSSTLVTIRNNNSNLTNNSSNQSTEKFSLTKTIKNSSARREDDDRSSQTVNSLPSSSSSSNHKVVISIVNDKYQKNVSPAPSITTTSSSSPILHHRDSPPVIKRLHDASIQTTASSSSSRSPIRTSSHRRKNSAINDEQEYSTERTIGDDLYEPSVKRTSSSVRKTTATDRQQQVQSTITTSTGSVKRTSTGVPVSSRITSSVSTSKQSATTQSSSTPGMILVTNLQPSVSEEDVIELFGQIGRINEITTLSQGCVQIVYANREHAEQAVTKYHNRLLDGQFMYVSLQQPVLNPKTTTSIQPATKDNGTSASSSSTTNQPLKFNTSNSTSNKITIDPTFIRQALFHPTNTTNPVQFQVKL